MPNTPKGLTYPSSSSPVAVPADLQELATDVDGLIVPNTGGTYTGSVSFTQPPSVPTPTSGLHAVNKTYADLINTDVTAIETELGTNPSGTFSTVVQRLDSYTDGFNKVGNLLTANQASVETDTTGFASSSGATLTRRTDQYRVGGAALLVEASSSSSHNVYVQLPVDEGDIYTFGASVMNGAGARSLRQVCEWYTAGMAYIGQSEGPTQAVPGTWDDWMLQGIVAPANAAVARIKVDSTTGDAGDSFWTDRLFFHKGAGGVWALPGTPIPGQSRIAVNNAVDLSGTGTPEGVVTAAPGSTWLQTDSVTDVKGWIKWIKATGTGNTGWIPGPEADTGWRAVTPGIAMFDVVHRLTMRRRGTTVTVVGRLQSTAGGMPWGDILSLPAGWRCVDYTAKGIGNLYDTTVGGYQPFVLTSLASTTLLTTLQPRGGSLTVGPNSSIEFEVSWTVDNAWPSSLPGSAA